MSNYLFPLILLLFFFSCSQSNDQNKPIDLLLHNGQLTTMDEAQPEASALAIRSGRIVEIGGPEIVEQYQGTAKKVVDLKGQFAMPGFIEGHGHFSNLGKSLIHLNFLASKNWQEIIDQVAAKAASLPPGVWIEGRGWHQEKWDTPLSKQVHGYPFHDQLSAVSPDNPVILYHASGHALFANEAAMQAAGMSVETPNPVGGEILRDRRKRAIGVFEERAMNIISSTYQEYLKEVPEAEQLQLWYDGIALAEKDCLSKGITSFQDAGSSFTEIKRYKEMAEQGELDLRLWAMVRHSYDEMKDGKLNEFPIKNAGNHFFSVGAIKTEVDGALGSFGAWLLRPYADKPNFTGQNTTTIDELENIADLAVKHDLQLCVHAIGDRANREVLDIFERLLPTHPKKDKWRWRIEHAQHLDPKDIPRFKEMGVIASMQGIHCTSDAPFVVSRLGVERSQQGAYPWRSLLDNGVVVANGTDAPVEDVSALASIYASVTRKRQDSGLEFFPEQSMTRYEALYSYTLGNAFAAFEEKDKGSLTKGKLGDVVVLSNNLLTCVADSIPTTRVMMTIVGGEVKFGGDWNLNVNVN